MGGVGLLPGTCKICFAIFSLCVGIQMPYTNRSESIDDYFNLQLVPLKPNALPISQVYGQYVIL